MSKLTPFVRFAPTLFYGLAGVDFLKNIIPLITYWLDGYSQIIESGTSVRIQVFAHLLSAVIYAASWIVYGVGTAILIAIFDRISAHRDSESVD